MNKVHVARWHQVITWSNVVLTHWGRVTICVSKLTIIGSDKGLSPGRCQAIIWTNAGILLIGPLGTDFSVILIEIYSFSFKKMLLKMSSAKWRGFCPGLNIMNVLMPIETLRTHLSESGLVCELRSGSTLNQVMTCRLVAPSYYLIHSWHCSFKLWERTWCQLKL